MHQMGIKNQRKKIMKAAIDIHDESGKESIVISKPKFM